VTTRPFRHRRDPLANLTERRVLAYRGSPTWLQSNPCQNDPSHLLCCGGWYRCSSLSRRFGCNDPRSSCGSEETPQHVDVPPKQTGWLRKEAPAGGARTNPRTTLLVSRRRSQRTGVRVWACRSCVQGGRRAPEHLPLVSGHPLSRGCVLRPIPSHCPQVQFPVRLSSWRLSGRHSGSPRYHPFELRTM